MLGMMLPRIARTSSVAICSNRAYLLWGRRPEFFRLHAAPLFMLRQSSRLRACRNIPVDSLGFIPSGPYYPTHRCSAVDRGRPKCGIGRQRLTRGNQRVRDRGVGVHDPVGFVNGHEADDRRVVVLGGGLLVRSGFGQVFPVLNVGVGLVVAARTRSAHAPVFRAWAVAVL